MSWGIFFNFLFFIILLLNSVKVNRSSIESAYSITMTNKENTYIYIYIADVQYEDKFLEVTVHGRSSTRLIEIYIFSPRF